MDPRFKNEDNTDIPKEEGANYMNEFFCSIGKSNVSDKEILNKYCTDIGPCDASVVSEFEFIEVRAQCVKKVVQEIDVYKSSSILHLNSKILKISFITLLVQLTHLFNCSLGTNIFPCEWKIGKIVPIPKTKERQYVTNWRPISLLALPGKLLEKIVHKQLYAHLRSQNLLSEKQHGFTKCKSTSTAVQDLMSYVCECINESKLCSGIYIDLSKAFDSLNHELLLYKLRDYGILNKSTPWFVSYLGNRFQKTIFNNIESTCLPVIHGVPQGSTLGPLLYIMYVNDCFKKVQCSQSKLIMYADDTVLLSSGDSFEEVINANQLLFNKYIKWADQNCLTINVHKTKQMTLCSRSKNASIRDDIHVSKDGCDIITTRNYVYLGANIDNNLVFDSFLKSIIQKVNYKLFLFSKIRYVLTFAASILVYKQMVLPFFDYLDILIDSGPKKYIDKLQTLQFRGIKIIYQYHYDGRKIKSTDEQHLHTEVGLTYLHKRRQKHLLQAMYSLKNRIPELLDTRDKGIELRSTLHVRFKEHKLNSELYIKSPYVRGCNLWKKLPVCVQKAKTKKEFDKLLTCDLIDTLCD